ncbi:GL24021 [Drosophila persimilis]|uniref:GL24021 n=1 Tax=Drosophila persimilis TaxID=7234 RepID=B4G330_DROPE|nr:GL24021 [Drosophila persimilis]
MTTCRRLKLDSLSLYSTESVSCLVHTVARCRCRRGDAATHQRLRRQPQPQPKHLQLHLSSAIKSRW